MGDKSSIEWTDATWNPVRGCSRVSEGCRHCYAEIMAARFSGPGMWGEGFAHMVGGDHRWTGKTELVESQMDLPLRWRDPRRIFVNSTSDLFHEGLSFPTIGRVVNQMRNAHWHTYQVLTKRSARLRQFAEWWTMETTDPLPRNLWLGVSVEDQNAADARTHDLRATPSAVRFLSCEPLLGPITLDLLGIDWVIAGAESGHGARPCDQNWVRDLRDQCEAAGVPLFYKQHAERGRKIPLPTLDGRQHVAFPVTP